MNNYEFLQSLLTTIPQDSRNITFVGFTVLIVASIIAALLISHLYLRFFDANSTGSRIHRAFPLLGPAVTTIFLTVQFSLPLSLGLLGALSIVRFRTPIKEPEEIGFILLVIACSISIATFNLAFAGMLYIIVFVLLTLLKRVPGMISSEANSVVLNVVSENSDGMEQVQAVVDKLNALNIKSFISSVHRAGENTNASIILKNQKAGHFDALKTLTSEFPELTFDYYRR